MFSKYKITEINVGDTNKAKNKLLELSGEEFQKLLCSEAIIWSLIAKERHLTFSVHGKANLSLEKPDVQPYL